MATNKTNNKSALNRPTKPRVAPSSQLTATSNSKSRPVLNASAGKENVQPRQDNQSGPQSSASCEEHVTLAAALQRLEEMEARLLKEQEEKQKLETIIDAFRVGETDGDMTEAALPVGKDIIPRPAGTSGKDWSLQVEMGLSESPRKAGKYAALLRGLRDLVLNAGIKWEVGWKEIPAADKSKMFQVARERFPILRQYANDWATAEMVKQYIKNKRSHHYRNGWLEVPEKYAYLKQNASKRSPAGSRLKRARAEMAATIAAKKGKHRASMAVHHRKNATGKAGVGMDDEDSEPPQEHEGASNGGSEGQSE